MPIALPSLPECKGDVIMLANYFIDQFTREFPKRIRGLSLGRRRQRPPDTGQKGSELRRPEDCSLFAEKSREKSLVLKQGCVFAHLSLGTTVELGDGMSNHLSLVRLLSIVIGLVIASVPAVRAQSAEAGQKVYAAQKCSICHSIAGTGNKKGPLDGIGAKLSADEIRQWITDAPAMSAKAKATRKPPMKAYMLPKDELDGLVAYLRSLK